MDRPPPLEHETGTLSRPAVAAAPATRATLDPSTARVTGLLYLGLALIAIPGVLVIRPMLFDPDSAAATLANLVAHEGLARAGIGLELGVVAFQALAAVYFYRLFQRVGGFAAGSVAAFGLMNAATILASAACLVTALDAALAPPFADAAGAPQLLYLLSEAFWGVGALFFGLWLVPMGVLALRAGLPRALGWVLVAGGIGYVVGGLVTYLAPAAAPVADVLPLLATVGEVWMIGWLLRHSFRAQPAGSRAA